MYEVFCKMKPGVTLLALYGSMHQQRRTKIYDSFYNKENAILIATDLVSRGLGKNIEK